MSTNTKEERSAKKTLERLKRLAITAAVVVAGMFAVAIVSGSIVSKRVDNKYTETIEEYKGEIERLSDEHEKMIRTYTGVSTEVDLNLLTMKVAEIAELATMEYRYTDAGRFSDSKELFGFEVPLLKKSFVAKWDGIIKAGIDMNQIVYSIDEENHVLLVRLPEATILSHEIVDGTIETLDETKNVFNPIKVSDIRGFDAECKEEMAKRAIESGLLEKARENAENVISKMFYQTPSIYTIQFEDLVQGDTAQP